VQHVAKISCRNSIDGECWDEKGKFRREKCNILQKSLVKIFIRLSNHPVKLILEAKKNFFDKIMKKCL
jgi:hypothetical protein